MSSAPKSAESNVLIIDNGAGSIKAGFLHNEEPVIVPNATAKVQKSMQYLVSDQIDNFNNGSLLTFTRPFDRGYLNNWQCEIEVWTRLFSEHCRMKPQETSLVLTEPPLNPTTLQNDANEVVFEYFGFKECLRRPAIWFSAYGCCNSTAWRAGDRFESCHQSCTVVDSGFSFTHVAPFINMRCQKNSLRRVNIGGKLLTNYLKELVSYRQWNMMDEFILINQVKEQLCFVSEDPIQHMRQVKGLTRGAKANAMIDPMGGKLKKGFVLPDFHTIIRGYVKPDQEDANSNEQILTMETERFSVPELLFYPSDIGLNQGGIDETAWQALQSLDESEAGDAASKIVLTGGTSKFHNFKHRFELGLRQNAPDIFDIGVYQPEKPDIYAWLCAKQYVFDIRNQYFQSESDFITREQYLEYGHNYCNEKFQNSW